MRIDLRGFACAALLIATTGCASRVGGDGVLRTRSLGDAPVELSARFSTRVYAHDRYGDTKMLLMDVPLEDVLAGAVRDGQLLHLEMLYLPKAGETPMDHSATNASIRHIVISDGEVGIYAGAGFAMPRGKPGAESLTFEVRDVTLRLVEATDGFVDPLTPARMTGAITATLDNDAARRMHYAMSQFVTNAMGRTRFVMR